MAKEWWKTFFDENYVSFWKDRGHFAHTRREVNFLVKNVPIRKQDLILDLCCGHGRHSTEFARRGFKVIGLDYSAYELGLAKSEAEKRNLIIDFRRGDARNFKFKEKFDVIINMFTAFGYGSKEDDIKIVRNVTKHLKKGGKFFIEFMNLPWLWRHYKSRDKEKFGDKTAEMERSYDFLTNVNHEKSVFKVKGKKEFMKFSFGGTH